MRISTAQRRPNASLITPTHPHLALQRYADHLLRALRLSLPVRSFRNLHRLWRHRHRRACRMRLSTAQCHSNAPRIAPIRLSYAEKPSSYPHPTITPRQPPSRYPSYTTSTSYQTLSRARSFCMRISFCRSPPSCRALDHLLPPTPHLATPCLPSLRPPLSAPSRAQYSALYVCWAR